MIKKSFILATLTLIFVIFLSVDHEQNLDNTKYVMQSVEFGVLEEVVVATGKVYALHTIEISSQVSGAVSKVAVDFNDMVFRDQILAQIDQKGFEARVSEAEAAVKIAEAAVDVHEASLLRAQIEIETAEQEREIFLAKIDHARARLALAKTDFERKGKLQESNTVSSAIVEEQKAQVLMAQAALRETVGLSSANEKRLAAVKVEYARAKAQLEGARAHVPQQKAALNLAKVELERTSIRTPIDGVIIDRSIEEGQTVAAALEAPTLFTIAEALDNVVVHVSVDETDIGRIKVGQKATFGVDAFPGIKFDGYVSEVRKSPRTIQNIVTYTVVVSSKNPNEMLFPGMTAIVQITIHETKPGLKLPSSTLKYSPNVSTASQSGVVWRLGNLGIPESVQVEILSQDQSHTLFAAPELSEGDEIISVEIKQTPERIFWGLW